MCLGMLYIYPENLPFNPGYNELGMLGHTSRDFFGQTGGFTPRTPHQDQAVLDLPHL